MITKSIIYKGQRPAAGEYISPSIPKNGNNPPMKANAHITTLMKIENLTNLIANGTVPFSVSCSIDLGMKDNRAKNKPRRPPWTKVDVYRRQTKLKKNDL